MCDIYKTITNETQGIYKDKGSKFLSYAYPVENEDTVKEKIDILKKEHFNARHHCYAYMLGTTYDKYRANDDGEPSNSAGKPILGQIQSFNLTNTLVVVVRYFGGTLLGVGGLISAYKQAAKECLSIANIVEKTIDNIYQLSFTYNDLNWVMKMIKDDELEIKFQKFEIDCELHLAVRKSASERFLKKLEDFHTISIKHIATI